MKEITHDKNKKHINTMCYDSCNSAAQQTVSVVIPTLNAENNISDLLTALFKQKHKPDEILVIDSSSKDATQRIVKSFEDVRLIIIPQIEFNHGLTRDYALHLTHGDYVFFLTQDAKPANNRYIDLMLQPFSNPKIAMVSGRQIVRADATLAERLIREFNYPSVSHVRSSADIKKMGIKTFFASDVCSAYRRSAYLSVGGFKKVSTNEDMFMAAELINNNFYIAYQAEALVIHSHNFTFKQQYQRNKKSAYEIEMHQNLLGNISLNSEGFSLVKHVTKRLVSMHAYMSVITFVLDCSARFIGNKIGTLSAKYEKAHHLNVH